MADRNTSTNIFALTALTGISFGGFAGLSEYMKAELPPATVNQLREYTVADCGAALFAGATFGAGIAAFMAKGDERRRVQNQREGEDLTGKQPNE